MKIYVVQREQGLPLRFTGEILGFAEDDRSIFILYGTRGGKYVCEKITLPTERYPEEKRRVDVCKTRAKIRSFFGESRLAADLYKMADLDGLPEVEEFEDIE